MAQTRSPEEVRAQIQSYIEAKRQAGESPDLNVMQRIILGTGGLGMMKGNIQPVWAALRGKADLWHGTGTNTLLMPNTAGEANKGGILNEGLVPEISERLGLDPNALAEHFDANKASLGSRIYYRSTPEGIAYWGGKGNEAGFGSSATKNNSANWRTRPSSAWAWTAPHLMPRETSSSPVPPRCLSGCRENPSQIPAQIPAGFP